MFGNMSSVCVPIQIILLYIVDAYCINAGLPIDMPETQKKLDIAIYCLCSRPSCVIYV